METGKFWFAMMHNRTGGIACLVTFFSLQSIFATEGPVKDLVEKLTAYESMQGEFVQRIAGDGADEEDQKGKFAVKKPTEFRWQITKPFPQLLTIRKDVAALYDEELEQLTIRTLQETELHIANLLSRPAQTLQKNFTVSREGAAFVLLPKQEKPLFKEIVVHFDQSKLSSIDFLDSLGTFTKISFHSIELNVELPDEMFTIEVPEGTEVVGDLSALESE